jgi:hypothetical protein
MLEKVAMELASSPKYFDTSFVWLGLINEENIHLYENKASHKKKEYSIVKKIFEFKEKVISGKIDPINWRESQEPCVRIVKKCLQCSTGDANSKQDLESICDRLAFELNLDNRDETAKKLIEKLALGKSVKRLTQEFDIKWKNENELESSYFNKYTLSSIEYQILMSLSALESYKEYTILGYLKPGSPELETEKKKRKGLASFNLGRSVNMYNNYTNKILTGRYGKVLKEFAEKMIIELEAINK